jgi:hypothetical protein
VTPFNKIFIVEHYLRTGSFIVNGEIFKEQGPTKLTFQQTAQFHVTGCIIPQKSFASYNNKSYNYGSLQ